MFLTVTLYTMEDQDRFSVQLVNPDSEDDPVDVTAQYELAAVQDEFGREGFTVLRSLGAEPRSNEGTEL
jgi:hypothetical protein